MRQPHSLSVRDLSFDYPGGLRLDKITFDVHAGELVALIGANGCGKTTLLRLLLGLLEPKGGSIALFGEPLATLDPIRRAKAVAYVAQQPSSSFPLTVRELVALGRHPHNGGWRESEADRQAIENAMERTGCDNLAHRPFNALSGGEKQKALIARALAQAARLVLLDEPTLHLDLNHQLQVLTALKKLCANDGIAVITVIHDINLASLFADQALCLKNGTQCAFGPVAEVVHPASIKALLGVEMSRVEDNANGKRYFVPKL